MIFPTVTGENLSGQTFTIPYGLEGEFNLLLIAFEPAHQLLLETWIPALENLTRLYNRFRYYELPTLWLYPEEQRQMIDSTMRGAILDPKLRELIITLYLDKDGFLDWLGLPGEYTIYPMLVDHAGNILWQTEGGMTSDKLADLRRTLDEVCNVDNEPL